MRAGQTLATLYSPELFTAQQELLEAIRMGQSQLIQAPVKTIFMEDDRCPDRRYREVRLYLPGCRDQVEHERYRPVQAGKQGDYVSQGAILFDVANLTKVWALFDAFEVDLPFLSKGDPVEFTLQALPGKKFSGKISFIDPILNTTTRTAKVRVEVPNASLELKPRCTPRQT